MINSEREQGLGAQEAEELPPKKKPATAVTTRRAAALASFASFATLFPMSSSPPSSPSPTPTSPPLDDDVVVGGCTAAADAPLPTAILHHLQHVRQAHNWDCGLACLLMVLKSVADGPRRRRSFRPCPEAPTASPVADDGCVGSARDLSLAELRDSLGGTTSIWTIDLAHLLASRASSSGRRTGAGRGDGRGDGRLRVTLCTTNAGANPAYALSPFYSRTLRDDAARVASLFESAQEAGVSVERRSVPAGELARKLLSGRYLVVALVDKRKLVGGREGGGEGEQGEGEQGEGEQGEGEQGEGDRSEGCSLVPSPPRTPPSTPNLSPCSLSPASSCSLSTSSTATTSMPDAFRTTTAQMSVVRLSSTNSSSSSSLSSASSCSLTSAMLSSGEEGATAIADNSPSPSSFSAVAPPTPQSKPRESRHLHNHHLRSQEHHRHHQHGYLGHFVLLCGYDAASRSFALRDPSDPAPRVRVVPESRLDEARSAFGTDEDLLIVELARPRPASLVSVAFGGRRGGRVGGGAAAVATAPASW